MYNTGRRTYRGHVLIHNADGTWRISISQTLIVFRGPRLLADAKRFIDSLIGA